MWLDKDVSWEFSSLFAALKRLAVLYFSKERLFCICPSTCILEERWILGRRITKLCSFFISIQKDAFLAIDRCNGPHREDNEVFWRIC